MEEYVDGLRGESLPTVSQLSIPKAPCANKSDFALREQGASTRPARLHLTILVLDGQNHTLSLVFESAYSDDQSRRASTSTLTLESLLEGRVDLSFNDDDMTANEDMLRRLLRNRIFRGAGTW